MKIRLASLLIGGGCALCFSHELSGSYMGLTARLHTTVQINSITRDVFRVYGVFSGPGDYLTSVAGSPTLGNMSFVTFNPNGVIPGGNFVNPVGGSATAPTFKTLGTQLEWDTFVTVGLASVPEGGSSGVGLSPGFNGIGNVSSLNTNNAGWFTAGPLPQGLSGNGVQIGGNWGVLIMQLTVNAGNGARGTVAIGGINDSPFAGATSFQTYADQTFTTHPPAPASLSLIAIGLVIGRSRRRIITA